jgi:hypothetical protein
MKRRSVLKAAVAMPFASLVPPAWSGEYSRSVAPAAFGAGGSKKMLYDVRQRPQAILFNDKVFIGFKGGGNEPASGERERVAPTYASLLSYDPASRQFSAPIRFGKMTDDHHDCPVIWADKDDHLHFLYKCHNEPGIHLVAKQPGTMGKSESDWTVLPDIAPKVSYPTVFRLYDDSDMVYFRTAGHSSSWSYRVTRDNGRGWTAPPNDVTNLDLICFPEWSSYQAKVLGKDGKTLHVVFTDYDDVKSNDPKRLYNPRYEEVVSNEHKYNLSYVRVNLETHEVSNFAGEILDTPVHYETARKKCRIWDTVWRGAGVPPALSLDDNGNPEILHVLSEENIETHGYYYVRFVDGDWRKTRITSSNHQWNSGYLNRDKKGRLHAYVIVGEGYADRPGINYTHGGGRIEHWLSKDQGNSWKLHRDITPDGDEYAGWSFNNVQPVVRADGSAVDGMLVFYGWLDSKHPDGVAFLLDESDLGRT